MIGMRNTQNSAAKKVHAGTTAIQWNKPILALFHGAENRINVWHGLAAAAYVSFQESSQR
jgi:hypothetical protein